MTDEMRAACAKAIHVVTPDGRVLRAGRAAMLVLRLIGWDKTGAILSWPPMVWGVELGYWIVANNRRFFARFLFTRE